MTAADRRLGQRARAARLARHLTQQQVADRMTTAGHRLHHSYVSKIESGSRPLLARELIALAAVLGITPAALLGGGDGADAMLAALWQRVEDLEAIRERYEAIRRIVSQPKGQPPA